MAKQIILHYPGSYVERPHTIVFDGKEEYKEFLQKKSYKLKPNVVYGVFTLGATISTEFASNNLKIEVLDKSDWTFNFPEQESPEIDIKVPETEDKEPKQEVEPTEPGTKENEDDDVIIINPEDEETPKEPEDKGDDKTEDDEEVIIINPDQDEEQAEDKNPMFDDDDEVLIFD